MPKNLRRHRGCLILQWLPLMLVGRLKPHSRKLKVRFSSPCIVSDRIYIPEELQVALDELKAQEDAYTAKTNDLKTRSETGGRFSIEQTDCSCRYQSTI